MKKLKSNEAADKKVPLVPLNHPEFSIVKEQFPPAGTAPNGGAPALPAPPEPVTQMAPAHSPTPAGPADPVVTGDKCQPLIAGENQLEQGAPTAKKNVSEIKRLHAETWGHARSSFDNGLRIGELLVAEKKRCGHDHWLAFVRDNLPFNERTARNYMRLFKQKEKVLKSENVSDLILTKAYGLLRKPRQRKLRAARDGSGIVDVEAHVVQTNSSPGSSMDPADTPPSHDAGGTGDAADNESCSSASQAGVIVTPAVAVAGSEPNGDAAGQSPGASPSQSEDEAPLGPSPQEAVDQTLPPPPEEDTADQTSAAPAATNGTEVPGSSTCVEFVMADGTTRRVPWQHNHLLPFKTIDKHVQATKEHYESINRPEYPQPVLVKFQNALISAASLAVSVLGSNPAPVDREIAFNALSDIRGMLPDPIPDARPDRGGRLIWR